MTTYVHGKNAVLKIGDGTNTLYDLSPVTNSADLPISLGTGEVTHFGDTAKEFIVGLADGTLAVQGHFDATIDGKIVAAINALTSGTLSSISFEWAPAGNTAASGNPKYTGSFIITNYTVTSAVSGVVSIKLDGQVTGPVTRGTY